MTWADFVKSAYNDGTFFIVDEIVYFDAGDNTDKVYGVTPYTFIKNGYEYSKDNISSGGNGNSSVT